MDGALGMPGRSTRIRDGGGREGIYVRVAQRGRVGGLDGGRPLIDIVLAIDRHDALVAVDTGLYDFFIYTTAPTRALSITQRSRFRLTPAPTGDLSVSFSLINVWNDTHSLDYATIFVGGKFNINVMMIPVRKTSLNTTISQRSVGST